MMESLYIDQEKYFGFFKGRPLIPGGQVWVFQQWNQDYYVMRGMEDDPMPPRSPFLERHATTIYKFRRSAVYPWSITLFEGSGLPVRVDMLVTIELRDPVEFIRTGQYETDNSQRLESALLKALRGPMSDDVKPQFNLQVVSIDFHDLTPPVLNQLLSETDLSHHVRGLREFKELGLEARVIVRDTHMPEAYKQIVHEATIAIQQQLLQIKRRLIDSAAGFEIKIAELEFRERLYQTQVGFYDEIFPRIQPTIEKVIEQVGNTAQHGIQPGLAATIFNDIIQQTIGQIVQSQGTISGNVGTSSPASGQNPLAQASLGNQRDAQIQALYQAAPNMSWQLSPPQNNVKEEILLNFGKNCSVLLTVPKAYPKALATISEVKSEGKRVPRNQILSVIQPITSGKYDLNMLVQAVADAIVP